MSATIRRRMNVNTGYGTSVHAAERVGWRRTDRQPAGWPTATPADAPTRVYFFALVMATLEKSTPWQEP